MEISATQLGAEAIKNTLNKVKLPPSAVEDVMMGLVHLWSFHTISLQEKTITIDRFGYRQKSQFHLKSIRLDETQSISGLRF